MTIWVQAQSHRYPVYIGYHLLSQPELLRPMVVGKQVLILSHPDIAAHYLTRLQESCQVAGAHHCTHLLLPAGESHKTLDSANQVWSFLLTHSYHRDTVILALGGGVIGDLAGFCAACFMRGVPVIQCPTSLLAQVDAAIGGKTGINHLAGKNMIGAFHAPQLVIADLATLATLPVREFNAGLAEVIKYGIALDADFFDWLENHMDKIMQREPHVLIEAVQWACRLKAQIVGEDEHEQAGRIVLNFGHTVAHAIESLLAYKEWLHGEAVAIGMIVAGHLSLEEGWITQQVLKRLILLIEAAQLPTKLSLDITAAEILAKLKHDKKHLQQKLRWVLLKAVGQVSLCEEISSQQITDALVMCGAKKTL